MGKTYDRSKKMLGVLMIICFVVSLTAIAASAQKDPVILNGENSDPTGNAVSNEHVDSGSNCTNGGCFWRNGGCFWRNSNPIDNRYKDA